MQFSQLQENLLQRLSYLVRSSASDFWRNGRFLVHTGRQLASHKDGNHEFKGLLLIFILCLVFPFVLLDCNIVQ